MKKQKVTDFSELAKILQSTANTTAVPAFKKVIAAATGFTPAQMPTLHPSTPPKADSAAEGLKKAKKQKPEKYTPQVPLDLVFKAQYTFVSINNLADNLAEVIDNTKFYTQQEKVIAKRVAADCLKLQELKYSQILNNNVVTAQYVQIENDNLAVQEMIAGLNPFEIGVLRQLIAEVFLSEELVEQINIKNLLSLVNSRNTKAIASAKTLDRNTNLSKARAVLAEKRAKK